MRFVAILSSDMGSFPLFPHSPTDKIIICPLADAQLSNIVQVSV